MAQVSITGTIRSIGNLEERGSFRKREVILMERTGQRDQPVPIEFTQDRISMLDGYKAGDEVTITSFVNGREWTPRDGGASRVYLSLSANRIERAGAAAPAGQPVRAQQAPPPGVADMPASADEDDLPF
jgi:hypothetical protein